MLCQVTPKGDNSFRFIQVIKYNHRWTFRPNTGSLQLDPQVRFQVFYCSLWPTVLHPVIRSYRGEGESGYSLHHKSPHLLHHPFYEWPHRGRSSITPLWATTPWHIKHHPFTNDHTVTGQASPRNDCPHRLFTAYQATFRYVHFSVTAAFQYQTQWLDNQTKRKLTHLHFLGMLPFKNPNRKWKCKINFKVANKVLYIKQIQLHLRSMTT